MLVMIAQWMLRWDLFCMRYWCGLGICFLREGGVYGLCFPGGEREITCPFPAYCLVFWGGVLTVC
tara:strand:- start:418 stop:612 length:195 start_codon:yes stop_codon:yes gene_type:complete